MAGRNTLPGVASERGLIVAHDHPAFASCPFEDGAVRGVRRSGILDPNDLEIRLSPQKTAEDVLVEVVQW